MIFNNIKQTIEKLTDSKFCRIGKNELNLIGRFYRRKVTSGKPRHIKEILTGWKIRSSLG